jgi:hypothetical protein
MIQAPYLDLHIAEVSEAHSFSVYKAYIKMHKVGSIPSKLQDIMKDIVKSHASETRVNRNYGA